MNIEFSLRGLLNALFRHFFKIFAITAVVSLLGVSHILSIEEKYEANAVLLVKFGEGALLDLSRDQPQEFSINDRREILESYIKIVESRDLLFAAVEKVGVDVLYPPNDDAETEPKDVDEVVIDPMRLAIARLRGGDLSVRADSGSNIIELNVRNYDPEVAAKFVQVLVDSFIAHQNRVYSVEDTNFLNAQVVVAEKALLDAKQSFLDFKQTLAVSDLPRELELLLNEKSRLSGLAVSAVSSAQSELEDLLRQEAEMAVTYQPNSPFLQSVRNRIDIMQRIVADKQNDLLSDDKSGTLAPRLSKIDMRIALLEQGRLQYEQYANTMHTRKSDYEYYKRKSEDARINDMLRQQNITRVSVLEQPIIPDKPVSAHKKLLLLGFIILGGFLGLGVSLVFELLDDRIMTVEAVTANTKIPLLVCFDRKERVEAV